MGGDGGVSAMHVSERLGAPFTYAVEVGREK
jgi:hypothetical protein